MPRLILVAALALTSLVGCEQPLPPPPARPPAEADTLRRDRALFEVVPRLRQLDQRIDPTDAAQVAAKAERWRAFAREAEGTPYAGVAAAQLAQIEQEAAAELERARNKLRGLYQRRQWKPMSEELARVIARHPKSRAAEQARQWELAIARTARQIQRAAFRAEWGFSTANWDTPEHGRVEIFRARREGGITTMTASGARGLTIHVEIADPGKVAVLELCHVSSWAQNTHRCLIDVLVNGAPLCRGWPLPSPSGPYYTVWPVAGRLQRGANTISINLNRGSLAKYWLHGVALSSFAPPSFAELITTR